MSVEDAVVAEIHRRILLREEEGADAFVMDDLDAESAFHLSIALRDRFGFYCIVDKEHRRLIVLLDRRMKVKTTSV